MKARAAREIKEATERMRARARSGTLPTQERTQHGLLALAGRQRRLQRRLQLALEAARGVPGGRADEIIRLLERDIRDVRMVVTFLSVTANEPTLMDAFQVLMETTVNTEAGIRPS